MNRLASPAQLRASYLRWALFLVPLLLLLGLLSARIGGNLTQSAWFAALSKPATFPPGLAFPLIWAVLYVLMGLALALVCSAWGARWRGSAILAFALQLAVNLAWSPVFFGRHEIGTALYVMLALDLLLATTVWLFWKVRPMAAWLMAPYLAWALFMTLLNWQLLQLNPELDGAEVSNAVQRIEL